MLKDKYVNIFILTLLDIFTKRIYFKIGDVYLTRFISLQPIINPGSSFSLFSNIPEYSYIIAMLGFIILILLRKTDEYFYTLLGSGILGNMYDRIIYHGVRDFIKTPFFTFNLADIYLTGAFIILLNIIKNETKKNP